MVDLAVEPLELAGVLRVRPKRFADRRGSFCETYRRDAYEAAGLLADFVQDNQARSLSAGTVRGLHFQGPPEAQAKLVQVLGGMIFDVAVDIRQGSPTYGQWCAATLTADSAEQLFIPAGFAHGYCTLEDDTMVAYKVDRYYAPECEGGIRWDDPAIGIAWPVDRENAIVSEKDRSLPVLAELASPFRWKDAWSE